MGNRKSEGYSVITSLAFGLAAMFAAGAIGDVGADGRLDSGYWFVGPAAGFFVAGVVSALVGGRAGAIEDRQDVANAAADDVLNGK